MKVVGLCGPSGAGKTQLGQALTGALRRAGCLVSVVKHAHKGFDIDIPGKDSYRHREAGAFEVVVASGRRLALVRELAHGPAGLADADVGVHELVAELTDLGDRHWVLVEGFKHASLPKIEVWREGHSDVLRCLTDAHVVALAREGTLPAAVSLPVFDLDDADGIVRLLMQHAGRYDYRRPEAAPSPAAKPG